MISSSHEDDVPPPADPADAAARRLRRYFAQHNRQALFLAALSLVASAGLWALIYALVYWFSLVAATVSRSLNADTISQVNNPELLGTRFSGWFALGAGLSLLWRQPSASGSAWRGCARRGCTCCGCWSNCSWRCPT